ncbi:hypothetical protein FNYG_10190 [Fusarium nygamai]|uniref:Uncharacterized protein n=1 Tax=Gibberella nygamai TaxID=42673 RepID=A0A2K0W2I3_GIBNY|nr:hypothetical protein FNYG_10190 [Fusarium nygamai]
MSTFERKIYSTFAAVGTVSGLPARGHENALNHASGFAGSLGDARGYCCCSRSNPTRLRTHTFPSPIEASMQAPSLDPLPTAKISMVRPIRIYAIEPRDLEPSPTPPLSVVSSKIISAPSTMSFGTSPQNLATTNIVTDVAEHAADTDTSQSTLKGPAISARRQDLLKPPGYIRTAQLAAQASRDGA